MKLTTLAKAEREFWTIVQSNDDDLLAWVAEWCGWFLCDKRYSSYEDGDEVRGALREFGIEPTLAVKLKHSRIVSLAREAAAAADVALAASAFIISSNVEAEFAQWQNPLRAISCIKQLPSHRFKGSVSCDVCGAPNEDEWVPMDAAQQFPSGYTAECWEVLDNTMIARWFAKADVPKPRGSDLKAFRAVLRVTSTVDPTFTAVKIAKELKKQLGGNVDTWRFFFETLGYAGVLKTDRQPGNLQEWTDASDRQGGGGRSEAPPPSCHWRRSMGFDGDVWDELFPQVRLPKALAALK